MWRAGGQIFWAAVATILALICAIATAALLSIAGPTSLGFLLLFFLAWLAFWLGKLMPQRKWN